MTQIHKLIAMLYHHHHDIRFGVREYDVLNGRGKAALYNTGNRRLREKLERELGVYKSATGKKERSMLIRSIVEWVRRKGGRFLKWHRGRFVDIGDPAARAKVGHALRDMLASKKESALRMQPATEQLYVDSSEESQDAIPPDGFYLDMFEDQTLSDLLELLLNDNDSQA